MLYTQKALEELARKRDQFAAYQSRHGEGLGAYRAALATLAARYPGSAALDAALGALASGADATNPVGARPTSEYDAWLATNAAAQPTSARLPTIPFGRSFAHHEEARAWAEVLRGVTTFAVDGSQLPPWRDASVPLALVQVGLFENPHQPPAPYLKDARVTLLAPDELETPESDTVDARTGEDFGYSERITHLRRYELEIDTIIERMRHHATTATSPTPATTSPSTNPLSIPPSHTYGKGARGLGVVAFYDGSLIPSFALKSQPAYRDRYVRASQALLVASAEYRIPVIGYIDTSYARDILTMVGMLMAAPATPDASGDAPAPPNSRGLRDALLWHGRLGWGDRTPAFVSARYDLARLGQGANADPATEVAFVYIQTALDRPPARIEFPRWLLDDGLLDPVMDTLRAEVIVGGGYPYPIEAADAVAVISAPDRAQFYALFQDFAAREGLNFTFSRKAISKSRRRL